MSALTGKNSTLKLKLETSINAKKGGHPRFEEGRITHMTALLQRALEHWDIQMLI